MKNGNTVLIAGYGVTVWTHEDSWPQSEYYEVCSQCASAWEACNATAQITREEAIQHSVTCARCGREIARIPWTVKS